MEPVQIHRLRPFGGVLVLIPSGHAERVALLPLEFLIIDHGVPLTADDVVDGRSGLADCSGGTACIQSLSRSTEDSRHCSGAVSCRVFWSKVWDVSAGARGCDVPCLPSSFK